MIRITFLMPQLALNGGIKVLAQYGRELIRLGYEVTFVAREPQPRRLRDILRGRAPLRRVVEDPSDYFPDLTDRIRIFPAKLSQPRESDLPEADFLVCSWWETVEWAQTMPASKGRLAHLMQGYEMFPWVPRERVARTYEADTIKIAVSRWVAEMVETHHGKSSAAIIHNAVDTDHFAYRETRSNDRLTLGMVYSQPTIKNSDMAFRLLDILAAQGIDARIVIFGSDKPSAQNLARPNVAFHHRPDQSLIPSLYQGCDLWLFPSFEEGFGLPLLEAMSCGTPVVSGMAGAAPEIIRDGENGYLCEPTPEEFAAAVSRHLHLAAGDRLAMSVAARRSVTDWAWPDAAEEFAAVLQGARATV